jgi:hypothetical protein
LELAGDQIAQEATLRPVVALEFDAFIQEFRG